MKKQIIIFCIFFLLTAVISFAQTPIPDTPEIPNPDVPETPGTTLPEGPKAPEHIPEPYTEDEFPEWMLDLRRAEIVFFGTLPFSFLIALEAVDIGRYFAHDQERVYAPWPFRDANAPAFTVDEQLWIVGSALFISLTAAVVDFFINKAVQAGRHKNISATTN